MSDSGAPRSRTPSLPKFGAQLKKLRGPASRAEICRQLESYGLQVDRSTLLQYERGAVKAPDPAILWALGRIYQQPSVDTMLALIWVERTGRELREGIGLTPPLFDARQVRVAHWFHAIAPPVQDAMITLLEWLASSAGAEHPETAPTRHAPPRVGTQPHSASAAGPVDTVVRRPLRRRASA